ncbi:MAG: hypothetical protein JWM65_656 [Sphingomonas bacterium]|nr:hypothetical protein [Sphingomonas bacterium]
MNSFALDERAQNANGLVGLSTVHFWQTVFLSVTETKYERAGL